MPFISSARGAYGPQGQKVVKGPLAPVWVTSGALANVNIGAGYSVQLSATDDSGDAPTYSLATGSLPSGITLSSSGILSGTAGGSAQTYTFTVNATDVNGRATTSSSLSITTINPELYSFTTVTFNTNNNTGGNSSNTGPDVSTIRSNATGTPTPSAWSGTYLQNHSQPGIFLWTVPATATYRIRGVGAGGNWGSAGNAGAGASMQGDFSLTQGNVLRCLVGHTGGTTGDYGGGGGGTFIYNQSTSTHLISAGGGGGGDGSSGYNSASTSSTSLGTWDGSASSYQGGGGCGGNGVGGGGFSGNGGNGGNSKSFLNGGEGSTDNPGDCEGNAVGGFGGGGAGGNGAGGGGGHYGGNAAGNDSGPASGGGGSYNAGSNQSNTTGAAARNNGFIVITKL